MRKFLALIMAVAMIATFACVVSAESAELTAVGENITYNDDGTVTLGAGSYFTAPIDLSGAEAVTVSFKAVPTGDRCWAFEITSENPHPYPSEHYLGALINSSLIVERYANDNGARPGSADVGGIVAGEAIDVVVVFNAEGGTVVSVNGEEKATFEQPEGYDLSIANCVGENPALCIGFAHWGDGEDSVGGFTVGNVSVAVTTSAGTTTTDYTFGGASATPADGADGAGETASQTGFATIALAIAAIGSGAYIVSKKH